MSPETTENAFDPRAPFVTPGWSIIVSAFAGTGKTFLAVNQKKYGIRILDLDPEPFMWLEGKNGPRRNPNYIRDYIDKLHEMVESKDYDIIFVSYLQPIRAAMTREGFIFWTIFPTDGLAAEYAMRLVRSGRSQDVAGAMIDNWNSYMEEVKTKTYMGFRQIILGKGEYMTDDHLCDIINEYGNFHCGCQMMGFTCENIYDIHHFFNPKEDVSKLRKMPVLNVLREVREKDEPFQEYLKTTYYKKQA